MPAPRNHFVHRAHADDFSGRGRNIGRDAAPQKFPYRFTRAQELAREIDRDHRVPLFERHILETGIALKASVVHENIDRAEFFSHPGEHRLDLIFPAHVRLKCEGPAAALFYDLHDAVGFLRTRDVINHDIGAGFAQREGARFANARVRTGDESFLISERFRRIGRGVHNEKSLPHDCFPRR